MVKHGKKQELSVVLATFNEEKNLPACLDSVTGLASEIVIVDGSSEDKTVEIAKKYGAKIRVTQNLPIFHINKQKAIDLATKDWILQLDADEKVTPELKIEIQSTINNQQSTTNGYWIPRKNWFLGRFLMKGGQYPDYTLRLYKRGKGKLPQKDVHEQAVVEGNVGYLLNPILHYPYKGFSDYILKWNRYCDLLAKQLADKLRNKSLGIAFLYGLGYMLVKPSHWFLTTYIRHKGFVDLWPGFIFSFFSALRFPVSYLRYLKILW